MFVNDVLLRSYLFFLLPLSQDDKNAQILKHKQQKFVVITT